MRLSLVPKKKSLTEEDAEFVMKKVHKELETAKMTLKTKRNSGPFHVYLRWRKVKPGIFKTVTPYNRDSVRRIFRQLLHHFAGSTLTKIGYPEDSLCVKGTLFVKT